MTESDLESSEVEILKPNQLQIMVKESGLEQSKGQFILEQFTEHFKMAAEWAKKAKTIIVTDESQTVNMKMARTGRLFLREKRLEIELARKLLKEQSLREGQAIDRIANFLKDMIIPTEAHLDRQENFVKHREAAKAESVRLEVEKKMEEERIAKEKADAEERDRLRIENEKMRKEAQAKEDALRIERRKAEEAWLFAEAKARAEQVDADRKINLERIAREKAEAELRAKRQAEAKAEADRLKQIEKEKSAGDYEKLTKLLSDIKSIQYPEVKSNESNAIVADVISHLYLAISRIQKVIKPVQTEEF